MNHTTTGILIVLLLILLNGLFNLSEFSIVSSRKIRLQQQAEDGDPRALKAIKLAENPSRFLSTVQIGITLIGILSGAFGGATLAEDLAVQLDKIAWLAPYSSGLSVAIVVFAITYLSLVLGELVPKRLALISAERVAVAVAPVLQFVARLATPVTWLLGASSDVVLRAMGAHPTQQPDVTEEDIKTMLDQGTEVGVFQEAEQDMVERIFRLGDRRVSALVTPRTDMVFLDIDSTQEEIHQKIAANPYSRYPVIQDSTDNIIGIAHARDLLLQCVEGPHFNLHNALHLPLYIPEATTALQALDRLKSSGVELAVVIDEYGGVLGIVSMNDILEAIVGEIATPQGEREPEAVQREDGSWLFDGMILVDELKELLKLDELPEEHEGRYETLGGLMMAELGRVPTSGDHFVWQGYRFEVMDMDGRRVDKVMVAPLT
jgi:putative hemolysin